MLTEKYQVIVNPQYLVVNTETHQVQSSWPTLKEAKGVARDLNNLIKPITKE